MPSLWLTSATNPTSVATLKAVRDALRFFNPDATVADAGQVLDALDLDGQAKLGEGSNSNVPAETIGALRDAGCDVKWNLKPQDKAEPPMQEPKPVMPDFSAYQTAMLLMASQEGNPLIAASTAIGLARTTKEEAFYTQVVASLILTFPWLEEMLRRQNLLI